MNPDKKTARHLQHRAGLALEPLEPRQLLTSYVGQSLADYFHAPLDTVTSANDALTFAFSNSTTSEGTAVVNGQFLHYSQIPGLQADDIIEGVNDSAMIVGEKRAMGASTRFLVRNGVRTSIADSVVKVDSDNVVPNYGAMSRVWIANDGTILLSEEGALKPGPVWLLRDGTLTFLWSGFATDIAPDGTVLGSRGTYTARETVLRSPDGTITVVKNMTGEAVGLGGLVVGMVQRGSGFSVATWKNGVVSVLSPSTDDIHARVFSSPPVFSSWGDFDVDSSGRVVATLATPAFINIAGTYFERYLFDPRGNVIRVDSVISGLIPDTGKSWSFIKLSEHGDFLTETAVIVRSDSGENWAAENAPAASGATNNTNAIAAVSASGDAVVLSRQGGIWHAAAVFGFISPKSGAGFYDAMTYVDPSSTLVYAIVVTPGGTEWMEQDPLSDAWFKKSWALYPLSWSGTNRSVFLSADGRAQLASVDADGHLFLTYELDGSIASVNNWVTVDLTDHLASTGQTFVPVAGNLTAWTMPWGAMNIAYLDSSGNAQVVWCTPGLPNWRIDNLSQSAGFTGTFHGILTSYTTPWNGQNVTATDTTGNLVTLWWAPGMSTWRADRLVGGTPAQLDENTITGFSTPWGGLNVVGLNKQTGKLTAYWWAPGMPAWIVEEFTIQNAPANLQLKGRIGASVAPNGNMFLAAVTTDNHLANIWLSPDTGLKWTFEDVTTAV